MGECENMKMGRCLPLSIRGVKVQMLALSGSSEHSGSKWMHL